jgi:hypothetical protein
VVANASGGSLDPRAVELIAANARIRVICGSENLVMPDHAAGTEALRAAKKAYCPTELGGMMGYLTAVEEYLSRVAGSELDVGTMMDAAVRLDGAAYEAAKHAIARGFAVSFEQAMKELHEGTSAER